ncbi:type II toxin-antitoxin system Phd/YefM family antitoxin [Cellulomonas shaoxiangyii]|uniref:Antitoxin n=1 Tax=Cellulomonas shaoxiangyii TaxID=2566013 RepID=A0A4P7SIN4_9CELL|nr:type II toxin-antitoxin system Phd/YefM family antitoxin [Cellulomonas shaoxiangyii]QCB92323.1 type II toxin-antitoxin system Phd/YefM family antitoxin [Cellulomonas shaoxiangyii]TGY86283.1 type II toxin-antitoxin system Phd/YefM family antitoxin [Cellulomonas shaoxiangyii]
MEPVSIYDAKTHLSRIVTRAEAGEETVITRHGRPVAKVVPMPARPSVRTPGVLAGRIRVADDFDAFTDEDARDWYGA